MRAIQGAITTDELVTVIKGGLSATRFVPVGKDEWAEIADWEQRRKYAELVCDRIDGLPVKRELRVVARGDGPKTPTLEAILSRPAGAMIGERLAAAGVALVCARLAHFLLSTTSMNNTLSNIKQGIAIAAVSDKETARADDVVLLRKELSEQDTNLSPDNSKKECSQLLEENKLLRDENRLLHEKTNFSVTNYSSATNKSPKSACN
ncbi:MAG: hypothetical protein LBT00_16460 [Spirochaetaceae bacterium]|nr:hypothetical protein [Spirochaetaceae bacterium]